MAKRFNAVEFWTKEVASQKLFIDQCGGTLEGYIANYGDPDRPRDGYVEGKGRPMFGNGGTAIWNADIQALERAQFHLEQALARQRR